MYSLSGLQRKCILDWPCGKCSLLLFILFSTKKLPGCPFCLPLLPAAWWSVTIPSDSPKIPSTQCQGSCGCWFGWLDLGVGKVTPTSRVFFLVALFTISKSPVVENKAVTSYSREAGSTSTAACVTCIVQGVTLNFYFEAEGSLSLSHLLKGKSFIFPLPIQGEFTVTQDCYYMVNWVKLKWCKPSTLSKTSIYIYRGWEFNQLCLLLGTWADSLKHQLQICCWKTQWQVNIQLYLLDNGTAGFFWTCLRNASHPKLCFSYRRLVCPQHHKYLTETPPQIFNRNI